MKRFSAALGAGLLGLVASTAAMAQSQAQSPAQPCGPNGRTDARSSAADPPATATVTPGSRAESPGTVGAYQNLDASAGRTTSGSPQPNVASNNAAPTGDRSSDGRC